MSATPARLAGVGVFVLGGLILFSVGLFMIGDRQMAFAKKFTVYAEFKRITGLQPGAIVRVSGAKAGSIKQILPPQSPSDKFRVQLEIREDLHQLVRTDSLASIETEGLVGGSYLGIGMGTNAKPAVPPESTIAGKEPFEISDLMQQMGDTIKKVNDTVDAMQDDVQRAVMAFADTAESTNALIGDVSDDFKRMAVSGARIADDAARIAEGIRSGNGTIGKLMNDDALYQRLAAISKQAEGIAADTKELIQNTKQVVENAKRTLEGFQSKEGPVQGMSVSVKQTMDDARSAVSGFAENMEALKRNFLLRGFFKNRGYFDLNQISPAEYRSGALTKGSDRRVVRVWLPSDGLFQADPDHPENERITDAGKAQVDAAIAPYLEKIASGVLIVEGYTQEGTPDGQYLESRDRASMVRDYLIGKFHFDPQATGAMPLSADSSHGEGKASFDGVALAIILPKAMLPPTKAKVQPRK